MKCLPASFPSLEMILLHQNILFSLNSRFSELLGLVVNSLKEDLRAISWILITLWVTSQLRTLEFQLSSWHSIENNPLGFWTLYLLGDSQSGKTTFFQTAQKSKLVFWWLLHCEISSWDSESHPGSATTWMSDLWPDPWLLRARVSFSGKRWGMTSPSGLWVAFKIKDS